MGTVFESDDHPDSAISVPDMVERWVARTPGHPAIVDGDGTVITYADLWQSAGEVARRLPIADGEVVGVSMPRSAAAVTAMLGVLRAGGVYCPASPEDPPSRTRDLQDRVGIRFVLHEDGPGSLAVNDRGGHGRVLHSGGEHPIYVMWTSGSTGEPKAVVIPHRGVVRLARDRTFMDLRSDDRVAFASNPMFDATTWEVWATLGNGATIVVIDPPDLVDPSRLRHRFEVAGVTRAFLTTSLFDLHASRDPSMFGRLRSLSVGGEPLRPRTITAVLTSDSPPRELVNGYGPTECTTFTTSHRVTLDDTGDARVPIGTPLLETMVAIVDDDGRIVPSGGEGELWVAGSGVALGYLGHDGLEQDRFVEVAFEEDAPRRWYRTGDLVRLDEHGRLDLLGRIDRQVKIRGYRIEPIEIEQSIASCDGVAEVAVVADRSSEIVRLCAFVVTDTSAEADAVSLAERIRTSLRADLPSYMIPARITIVDHLPLTPNGKLDAAALLTRTSSTTHVPRTSIGDDEHPDPLLAEVLARSRTVLAGPDLGPEDDLWEAGLDSLAAIELAAAMSEVLGRAVHPTEFLDHPTPSAIAALDRSPRPEGSDGITVFDPSSAAEPIFAVMGRGASALALRHVARHLTDIGRQLVVIESGRFGHHGRAPVRIESIAASVADEVEDRRPDGVVLLAGWSAGGVIATHTAWLLEGRGREVRLMLFDTIFMPRGDGDRGATVIAGVRHLARRVRHALTRRSDPDGHGARWTAQATEFARQVRELRAYGAPPSLDSPIANLHVAGSAAASVTASVLPRSIAIEVGGDHNSMFDPTNAGTLVERLGQWLASTEETGSRGPVGSAGSSISGDPLPRR